MTHLNGYFRPAFVLIAPCSARRAAGHYPEIGPYLALYKILKALVGNLHYHCRRAPSAKSACLMKRTVGILSQRVWADVHWSNRPHTQEVAPDALTGARYAHLGAMPMMRQRVA